MQPEEDLTSLRLVNWPERQLCTRYSCRSQELELWWWRDNLGWDGQYDTISVIEMDNKDLSVSGIEIDPVDRYFGFVGEGNRNINVTVTNTGMDVLNGQSAQLDVELKVVDELNSTNQTVYAMDWDNPENKAGCVDVLGTTWIMLTELTTGLKKQTIHPVLV